MLGVDPGTSTTGLGLVEERNGELKFVKAACIKMSRDGDLAAGLKVVFDAVSKAIADEGPDAVAVEEPFHARNARIALAVGQVRGVAVLAAIEAGLPVASYSVREVKQAVVGYGAATKQQVQEMVRRLLGEAEKVGSEHESDALAVAICHVHAARWVEKVAGCKPAGGSGAAT